MPITIGNKKFYTVEEYAALCGVTLATVYNKINSKELETKIILGKTLVRAKD